MTMDFDKLKNRLNQAYVLTITTAGLAICELGRYIVGSTSRETARDLKYGDVACVLNVSLGISYDAVPQPCESIEDAVSCMQLELNGTKYCEFDYNGLGYEYQILAGPGFTFPLCIATIVMGILGDRYNRVFMLAACTFLMSISIFLQGAATEYWHLLLLRAALAIGESGCIPFAAGVLSDVFSEEVRGIVMSLYNSAIYFGYGISFPVGRYLKDLNVWNLGWRFCYYCTGTACLVVAILTFFIKEPQRTLAGEEKATMLAGEEKAIEEREKAKDTSKRDSLLKVLLQPRMIIMCIAGATRYAGGAIFSFVCDLYYRQYFPGVDLAWYLFIIFCIVGTIGVAVGGVLSDSLYSKYGVAARIAVIAGGQVSAGVIAFAATPFAFGSVYFDPPWAMITLGLSYFFTEMWYGNVFAAIVEMVPMAYRSSIISVHFCAMTSSTGLITLAQEMTSKAIGFRESLYIFYVGFYLLSGIIFYLVICFTEKPSPRTTKLTLDKKSMPIEIPEEFAPNIVRNTGIALKTNIHRR